MDKFFKELEFVVKCSYNELTGVIPDEVIQPIVRCRDCIGLVETWDGWECERFSGEYHRAEPNDFCSWGERK